MTNLVTVLLVALVTVGSRVGALAALPAPKATTAEVIARLPAPLFAALAMVSLFDATEPADANSTAVFVSAACATAGTQKRSLMWVFTAGLCGYAAASLLV